MESIINVETIQPEIIFLHGLDQNFPWKEIFENYIKKYFLHTKFIFPQGSLKSIKINGLMNSPENA